MCFFLVRVISVPIKTICLFFSPGEHEHPEDDSSYHSSQTGSTPQQLNSLDLLPASAAAAATSATSLASPTTNNDADDEEEEFPPPPPPLASVTSSNSVASAAAQHQDNNSNSKWVPSPVFPAGVKEVNGKEKASSWLAKLTPNAKPAFTKDQIIGYYCQAGDVQL